MHLSDILQLPKSAHIEPFENAIKAIDSLHRFPHIEPFPLSLTRKRREQGAYEFHELPNRPVTITISRLATHPQFTLAHEVGHLMDHLVLNRLKGGFARDYDDHFLPLLPLL
jgi:hypothetical protein